MTKGYRPARIRAFRGYVRSAEQLSLPNDYSCKKDSPEKVGFTPPKFNSEFTPEKMVGKEDKPFPIGKGNSSGPMLNFGRVTNFFVSFFSDLFDEF